MPAECLEGYVHMLEILVTKYGIPENIYCDRHTILIMLEKQMILIERLKVTLEKVLI